MQGMSTARFPKSGNGVNFTLLGKSLENFFFFSRSAYRDNNPQFNPHYLFRQLRLRKNSSRKTILANFKNVQSTLKLSKNATLTIKLNTTAMMYHGYECIDGIGRDGDQQVLSASLRIVKLCDLIQQSRWVETLI